MPAIRTSVRALFALFASMLFALLGCTQEVGGDASSASEQVTLSTVRVYHLNGKLPATFEDVALKVSQETVNAASPGELGEITSKLIVTTCSIYNGGLSSYLMVHHSPNLSTSDYYVCIQGSGDLDLTTTYYANTTNCVFTSNPAACVANLRLSGNVKSLWNGNQSPWQCSFLGPNFSVYSYYHVYSGYTPYYQSVSPSNLINATYLSCY